MRTLPLPSSCSSSFSPRMVKRLSSREISTSSGWSPGSSAVTSMLSSFSSTSTLGMKSAKPAEEVRRLNPREKSWNTRSTSFCKVPKKRVSGTMFGTMGARPARDGACDLVIVFLAMLSTPCVSLGTSYLLSSDADAVIDFRHAGCRPRHSLGFLTLGPGPHRSGQDHFIAVELHLDHLGIELGIALQRLLYSPLDFDRLDGGFKDDEVTDALHAFDPAHRPLGVLALILPLDSTLQRDPAILYGYVYFLPAQGKLGPNRRYGITGDFRIGALIDVAQPHLDVVGHADDTRDTFGSIFRFVLLKEGANKAAQEDHAILCRDGNVGCVELGMKAKLLLHVIFDNLIRLHMRLRAGFVFLHADSRPMPICISGIKAIRADV